MENQGVEKNKLKSADAKGRLPIAEELAQDDNKSRDKLFGWV